MKKLLPWLCAGFVVTLYFGTMLGAVQHVYRSMADDPQAQQAADAARLIDGGLNPSNVINSSIDIEQSEAPFLVVYSIAGKPLVGSGKVGDKLPEISLAALKQATVLAPKQFTWEPRDDLRIASTVIAAKDYYVVGGKSLKSVERRMQEVNILIGLGWISSEALLLSTHWFLYSAQARRLFPVPVHAERKHQ